MNDIIVRTMSKQQGERRIKPRIAHGKEKKKTCGILSKTKNVISLQTQNGRAGFPYVIVPWCNGNTTDFGSVISSSNLDGITRKGQKRGRLQAFLFLFRA